ncbi:hypothetical protein ACT3CE_06475 [Marinifilum sp. RC60d5]|uniref:hypothetical protein n=1 Tax=Marinifilum sp. RC60d5 TaxID=3458414 RepID=UPI004036F854
MLRFKIIVCLIFCLVGSINAGNQIKEFKTWITIEGKINNLNISAEFQNNSNNTMVVDYILKINKQSRVASSSTLQKGKCISKGGNTISFSESRMNLSAMDNLYVSLFVYHNKRLIAQDSVVFHGDNL